MNILNLAHGEFYMLGAFSILYLAGIFHLNYFLALFLSMVLVGVIGIFFERLFFRPVAEEMAPTIIVGIGLMWIIRAAAQLIIGREPRGMAEIWQGNITFLGVTISGSRIMACIISVILVVILYFFVYRTKFGRAMQAIAQDREAAALQGIDIDRMSILGFTMGCAMAGVAGGIMAPIFFIDATMGIDILVKSIAIIILGGVGSIPGAALGGLVLGILESYGQTFLGYSASLLPFLLIIVVLICKPTGLMGRKL